MPIALINSRPSSPSLRALLLLCIGIFLVSSHVEASGTIDYVDAFLCDENNHIVQVEPGAHVPMAQVDTKVRICFTSPSQQYTLTRMDYFEFSQRNLVQDVILEGNIASGYETTVSCMNDEALCVLETIVDTAFFTTAHGASVDGTGVVVLTNVNDTSSQSSRGLRGVKDSSTTSTTAATKSLRFFLSIALKR